MVQLYEDQILRGKDMTARAELARKVARMWEEQLADPREAADAWRRVLRMKQADTEATAGLDRAKSNMLKKPEPGAEREAYAPPKLQQTPPPPEPKPKPEVKVEAPKATEPAPPPVSSVPPQPKIDPLAASLRAALTPEPDEEHEHEGTNDVDPDLHRPARPEGLFFRSSLEEVTVSAPGTQPEMNRATRPADEQDRAVLDQTFAPGLATDELLRTNEGAALDFLDSTLARPPKLSEPPPALLDTGEHAMADMPGHEEDEEGESEGEDFEEEVIIADDLAEMIDAEDDAVPPTEETPEEKKSKRSLPPPIPRQS